jgi:dTDP-4-amino-4,6-dideoxygalactose transaminase
MPNVRQVDPGAFVREHRRETLAALERVADSGWYILGAEVAAFEREFAAEFGLGHTTGVGNGTDAVALALRALGVGPASRVATVSHTAVATVAAIEMIGATPVFIDIDIDTYTLDPRALALAIERAGPIDAVVAVHLYGQPADVSAIVEITRRAGIPVVEDCAQAHGARIGDRWVGGLTDAAAFSFYPTKNLGCLGDGGLVASGHEPIIQRAKALREYGWGQQRFVSEVKGTNSRLDELQAAFLRLRLPLLQAANHRRARIAATYQHGLSGTGLVLPAPRAGTTHVYHQYVVRHAHRDELAARLRQAGIATGVHYPVPIHRQPAYEGRCPVGPAGLEATEKAAREVLSLPMYPELDDAAVAAVIDAVRRLL